MSYNKDVSNYNQLLAALKTEIKKIKIVPIHDDPLVSEALDKEIRKKAIKVDDKNLMSVLIGHSIDAKE